MNKTKRKFVASFSMFCLFVCMISVAQAAVEVGSVTYQTGEVSMNHKWTTVTFDESFANTPIVFAEQQTENGGEDSVIELRNVGTTSFQMRIEEDRGKDKSWLNGSHYYEDVAWIAFDPNDVIAGYGVEAGIANFYQPNYDYWEGVNFTGAFTETPIVFYQTQTRNGGHTERADVANISASGFEVRVEEDPGNGGSGGWDGAHLAEDVGYLALTPSLDLSEDGVLFGGESITNSWTTVCFQEDCSETYEEIPSVFADIQTENESDTVQIDLRNITTSGFDVRLDELTQAGWDGSHTGETLGWFAYGVIIEEVEPEPEPDLYFNGNDSIGIYGDYGTFYANVCGVDVEDAVDVLFEVDGQSSTVAMTATEACTGVEVDVTNFTLDYDTTYTLTVTIDPSNQIEEVNEGNNTSSLGFLIPDPDPDPLVEDLLFDGGDPVGVSEDYSTFYANVCGVDTEGLTGTVEVLFEVDGQSATEIINAPVGCEEITVTPNFTLDYDVTYTLTVTIDPSNQIEEIDEGNNTAGTNFLIPAPLEPDLYFDAVGIYGDFETFYANVCGVDVEGTVNVLFDIEGQSSMIALNVPETCTEVSVAVSNFTLDYDTTYTLTVTIDPSDEIGEVNEGNNTSSLEFSIPDPNPEPEYDPSDYDVLVMETSSSGVDNIVSILQTTGYNVDTASISSIENGISTEYEILVMPGSSDPVYAAMNGGLNSIQDFTAQGGGVIGVCGGAIAGSEDARFIDYFGITLSMTGVGQNIRSHYDTGWTSYIGSGYNPYVRVETDHPILGDYGVGNTFEMAYRGGPVFEVGNGVTVLLDYTETFSNSYAAAGQPAAVATEYGDGKVVLFALHPEFITSTNFLLSNAAQWVNDGY